MKMDVYIKRRDVLSLAKKGYLVGNGNYQSIKNYINSIPVADVIEVVRCKDCCHRDPEDLKCDCGQLERAGCVFPVDDDYFCAYGVKRDG